MNAPEILRQAIAYQLQNVHTSMPGRIERYDPSTQKASVKPLVKRLYADGKTDEMPIISNVPVIFPRTAAASLTLKVQKGDGVLLTFCERALEEWLGNGGEVTPGMPRTHDLNDAVAIAGLYSFASESPGKDNFDAYLQAGDAWHKLDGGKATLHSKDTTVEDDQNAKLNLKDGKATLESNDTTVKDSAGASLHLIGGVATLSGTTATMSSASGAAISFSASGVEFGSGGNDVLQIIEQALTLLGQSNTTQVGTQIQSGSQYAQLAAKIRSIRGV